MSALVAAIEDVLRSSANRTTGGRKKSRGRRLTRRRKNSTRAGLLARRTALPINQVFFLRIKGFRSSYVEQFVKTTIVGYVTSVGRYRGRFVYFPIVRKRDENVDLRRCRNEVTRSRMSLFGVVQIPLRGPQEARQSL
jgi:hypothetical protein